MNSTEKFAQLKNIIFRLAVFGNGKSCTLSALDSIEAPKLLKSVDLNFIEIKILVVTLLIHYFINACLFKTVLVEYIYQFKQSSLFLIFFILHHIRPIFLLSYNLSKTN